MCELVASSTQKPIQATEISNNASLDRIDSSKGYVLGNVQWVLSEINMMKQQYSQNRFIELCIKVAHNAYS